VDREASNKEKGKDLPTLKDNDFIRDGGKIHIGDEAKEKLMETLTADVEVCLEELNLTEEFCNTELNPVALGFCLVSDEASPYGLFPSSWCS